MTHMRYWAATLGAAAAGGFIAIAPFAFNHHNAIWSAFAVAIAGGLLSLAGVALALRRDDFRFSGISALGVLVAGFTIIATRDFTGSTALWLTFAGGVAPGIWRRHLGFVLDGLAPASATALPRPPLTPAQLRRVGTMRR